MESGEPGNRQLKEVPTTRVFQSCQGIPAVVSSQPSKASMTSTAGQDARWGQGDQHKNFCRAQKGSRGQVGMEKSPSATPASHFTRQTLGGFSSPEDEVSIRPSPWTIMFPWLWG